MDPLFALLNPVVGLLNRQIAESTAARERCERLEGRTIAVRVKNTALAVAISVEAECLALNTLDIDDPDVVISGSLLALARLAGENGEALIREGRVELTGDATIAEDFRELLRHARPDWEEQLSGVVGDGVAHGVGETVRRAGRWGREARATMRANVSEYLQEESRAVPSRFEVEEFSKDVQRLRDDVDRLAARLARLEAAAE